MMNCRSLSICLLFSGSVLLLAKDFWDQPFDHWKRDQVMRVLSDSPWAQSETFSSVAGGRDDAAQGEKERYYKFTARLFSSLPIREAYVRMAQLMNNYDEMGADQKQVFDTRFKKALNLDVADRVIVAVDYGSNDPDANRDLRTFFSQATVDTLKQNVYLITQHQGRVQLKEYFPPSNDGTGAKFIFPRQVNGQPVVTPDDKEVRFDFSVPVVNQRMFVTFKVPKLMYHDQLTY